MERGARKCDLDFRRFGATFGSETGFRRTKAMTDLEIFFYVVLPVAFVVIGWIAVWANERHGPGGHTHHPAE